MHPRNYMPLRGGVLELPFLTSDDRVCSIDGDEKGRILVLSENKGSRKITLFDQKENIHTSRKTNPESPTLFSLSFLPEKNLLLGTDFTGMPILLREDNLEYIPSPEDMSEHNVFVFSQSKTVIVQLSDTSPETINLYYLSPTGFILKKAMAPNTIWPEWNSSISQICRLSGNNIAVYSSSQNSVGIAHIDVCEGQIISKSYFTVSPSGIVPFKNMILALPGNTVAMYSEFSQTEDTTIGRYRIFEQEDSTGVWKALSPDIPTPIFYDSFRSGIPFPYIVKNREENSFFYNWFTNEETFMCVSHGHHEIFFGSRFSSHEFFYQEPEMASFHRYQWYEITDVRKVKKCKEKLFEALDQASPLLPVLNAIVADYVVSAIGMFGSKKTIEAPRTIIAESTTTESAAAGKRR